MLQVQQLHQVLIQKFFEIQLQNFLLFLQMFHLQLQMVRLDKMFLYSLKGIEVQLHLLLYYRVLTTEVGGFAPIPILSPSEPNSASLVTPRYIAAILYHVLFPNYSILWHTKSFLKCFYSCRSIWSKISIRI